MRLGRRAVDLVGQQDVGENGTVDKRPGTVSRGHVFFNDVGAGDVGGHQVRCELNALERQAESLGDGPHHQRLRRSRHARDEAVPAHEQRDQHLLDHIVKAHDYLVDLGQDLSLYALEAIDSPLQFPCV